jgi:hypothetical protein
MSLSTANTTNQQYSANLFTDISAPGAHNQNVLQNATTSNVAAVNASKMIGGLPFLHNGGIKKVKNTINRRKINKISNKYKMRGSRKQIRRIKSRLLRRTRRTRSNRGTKTRRRRTRGLRGGINNVTANASYSTGGPLSAKDSAMANPVPFASNDVNSFDTYNHFR